MQTPGDQNGPWLERDPEDFELDAMSIDEVMAIWKLRGSPGDDQLIARKIALQTSPQLKREHEDGAGMALFDMLHLCARSGLRMPEWAAEAFLDGYADVLWRRKGSWDDAFGRPVPKGTHIASAARRLEIRRKIAGKFFEWRETPPAAIDDNFFEKLGAEFGVSKTVANEIYYELKRDIARSMTSYSKHCRENDETSGNTEG